MGRDEEVNKILQIFCRKSKNNPVLVGHPGVGKTAIIHALAQVAGMGDNMRSGRRGEEKKVRGILIFVANCRRRRARKLQKMSSCLDRRQYSDCWS